MAANLSDRTTAQKASGPAVQVVVPTGKAAGQGQPQQPRQPQQAQPGRARRLTRVGAGLVAVVAFQALFASVFLGVLHRATIHNAPVAVAGAAPLASAVARHGDGAIRLVAEPSAGAAQAAVRGGNAYAAVLAGRHGETLLIETAASPGTAAALTKGFTTAAAALKVPLQVRDLAPLPASDPSGVSAYFLVAGWMLGGYLGATVLGMSLGGVRSPGPRHAMWRLALLAGYAVASGAVGALLFGPGLGVMSGFSAALAGVGMLIVLASAAATAGLQALLGMPGTLLAIIGIVIFGNPTAGQSIATPLLASPWNVIGQGLPPSAGLTAARSVIYLGGVNIDRALTVLAVYVAAGAMLVLAAAWWRSRAATGAAAGQPA